MGIPQEFRLPPQSADTPIVAWHPNPRVVLVVGLACWVAAYGLSQFMVSEVGIPAMFLPAGIAVGLLLRLPVRLWWWVLAAMLAVDVGGGAVVTPPAVAVIWGVANATQTLALAGLLRWARVDMTRTRDPFVIAAAAGGVVALVAAPGAIALGTVSAIDPPEFWADWWGADVLSIVLVVPVVLMLGRASWPRGRSAIEAGLWLMVAIVGLVLQFSGLLFPQLPVWLWLILGTPLIVLYSVRFGLLAMSGLLLLLDAVAVTFTAAGLGPFQELQFGSGTPLRALQMVLIVLAVSVQCVSLLVYRTLRHGRTLAGQQALLDAVLEGSPVPTALMDADSSELIRTNPAFRRLLPHRELADNVIDSERAALQHLLTEASEQSSGEFAVVDADDEPRLIRLRVTSVAADDFDRFGMVRSGVNVARVVHAEDMTDVRRREDLLRRAASTDPLTGLANRRQLLQVLETSLHSATGNSMVSLAYIDLDGFKEVNDQFGHAIGDTVLQQVADCLRDALSPSDVAARTGGDEFVVVSVGLANRGQARARAEGLLKTLLNNPAISSLVGASVGVAVTSDPTVSADALLRHGDRLMYSAKGSGGSCVVADE